MRGIDFSHGLILGVSQNSLFIRENLPYSLTVCKPGNRRRRGFPGRRQAAPTGTSPRAVPGKNLGRIRRTSNAKTWPSAPEAAIMFNFPARTFSNHYSLS